MLRRWLIRSFFLMLLLLCAAAWTTSHFWRLELGYNSYSLSNAPGHLCLTSYNYRHSPWYCRITPVEPGFVDLRDTTFKHNFLGFGAGDFSITLEPYNIQYFGVTAPAPATGPVRTLTQRFVRIPFWFLTTASALLLFFVWRKTTPLNPTRAFPIETTQPSVR